MDGSRTEAAVGGRETFFPSEGKGEGTKALLLHKGEEKSSAMTITGLCNPPRG